MFKKGLVFGIIGFAISFGTLFFFSKPGIAKKKVIKPTYNEGVNGWLSFSELLSSKIGEPVALNDDLFISMLMEEIMGRIPNPPVITITGKNHSILWYSESEEQGKEYSGQKVSGDEKFVKVRDSVVIEIGSPIKLEGKTVGYQYIDIEIKNKPNPRSFALAGWRNYASLLAYSVREGVAKNKVDSNMMSDVSNRSDLLHLTILSIDKTILWDKNKAQVGKKYKMGWIEEAKTEEKNTDESYFSLPVEFQGKKVGETYFLINLPITKEIAITKELIPKALLTKKNLIFPIASFVILFLIGGLLSRATAGTKAVKLLGEKEDLESLIQDLKKESKRLEERKDGLTSEIAGKQKVKKDLENEVQSVEEKIESIMSKAFEKTSEGEEEALFANLFGEEGVKGSQRKEELELAQRVVEKRREEIALSGSIESKRKELVELERKIERLKQGKSEE